MNRRRNLETYDLHARMDRLIACAFWIACVLILLFTGAGSVMWQGLTDTVAAWWLL